MLVITMPHIQDITITNIHTITEIMGVMATVITRPLGLATATAEAIMLMVVIMAVIEAVTAGAIMAAGLEAAFTVVIDKNGNILSRISGDISENGSCRRKYSFVNEYHEIQQFSL